jgi:Asp-tRNA(Asn)/Glu-tRNA(Gln) amidotransferase A subunit family amidase
MVYDLKPIKAPRLTGNMMRLFAQLVEQAVTGQPLIRKMLRDLGVIEMLETPADEEFSQIHPLLDHQWIAAEQVQKERSQGPNETVPIDTAKNEQIEQNISAKISHDTWAGCGQDLPQGFAWATAEHFVTAYRDGSITPEEVAERVIEWSKAGEQMKPQMRIFIAQDADDVLQQAKLSAQRYREGKSLGPLDGVPIAVKDELDQKPYPTTVGTSFLGKQAVNSDAEVVARLRKTGAILIGKTNMHEMGMGVTGLNPHHGSARNPYDPNRATGGSSSGSAAAVAAGLCPIAIGADGGGSIRIPAALCGIFGLKPNFGRVSERGAAPLCWSVAHIGPMASSVRDLALAYAAIAGPDPKDRHSLQQPSFQFGANNMLSADHDLSTLRIGIFRPWFEDAQPDIVHTCNQALTAFRDAGAKICDIELPELKLLNTVHLVTIVSEMAAAHLHYYRDHYKQYSLETRINLAIARSLRARDYLHAQRLRQRLCNHFFSALHTVDLIATPTTACTAPILAADALKFGESNLSLTTQIMRFAPAANLTGLPAISIPVGYDKDRLPIGLQLIARPWQETALLHLADIMQALIPRLMPTIHRNMLLS